jgi:C-terminal processing protease CtpA/Prc
MMLAALGRHFEARRALVGELPPIPEALYREAWSFVRDATFDRTFNGQDWLSWKDRYRGELKTPRQAYHAIATMLASLGDRYTRLRSVDETAAVYLTRHGGRAVTDRLGRKRPYSQTVITRDLDGGLGYIQLSNLTDPKAVADLRAALNAMREKEGIILDLRGNTGGLTRAADAIGDLLVGPGEEAGIDRGPDGETVRVTGGEGAITDSPLVVLVDGQTASAAERLAGTLAATGRASLLGETTHGKGRYQSTRVLPGGVTVLVSTGQMLDRKRRQIQGRGLEPGAGTRGDEEAGEGQDDTIDRARQILESDTPPAPEEKPPDP